MSSIHEEPRRAEHLAEILKALAHPLRLRIVAALAEAESNVNALAEKLAAPQSIVSQQLRILRMSGLVEAARENGFARYHLAEPQLRQMLVCMDRCAIPARTLTRDAAELVASEGSP